MRYLSSSCRSVFSSVVQLSLRALGRALRSRFASALGLSVLTLGAMCPPAAAQANTATLSVTGTDPYNMTCNVVEAAIVGVAGPTGTVTFSDLTTGQTLGTSPLGGSTTARIFQTASYSVGDQPLGIAYGDFNGDGKLDLAVTNSVSGTVSILLGNGDGTFQTQSVYDAGTYPRDIVAGDFNGDGKLDLAVSTWGPGPMTGHWSGGPMYVLLGNGDGTFQAPVVVNSQLNQSKGLVVADFNGDGKLDLAVSNPTEATISILLGNGDGTFQAPQTYAVGSEPEGITVGDFNNDGNLDLVVANTEDNTLSVLLGNGDGTFQPQTVIAGEVGTGPISIAAADFNADGKLDLAVTSSYTVNILLGNGDGTFQYSPALEVSVSPANPSGIAVGDFNGDGIPDLAVTNSSGATLLVLTGNGNGTFTVQDTYPAGTAPDGEYGGSGGLVAADFSGDGNLDLAGPNFLNESVSVFDNVLAASAAGTLTDVIVNPGTNFSHSIQCSYGGDKNYAPETSNTVVENYTQAAVPFFSLLVGNYPASQPVSITDATPGAVIYYTSDGSTPTTNSMLYSSPFTVSSSVELKAIDAPIGCTQSAVSEVIYNIAAAPALSLSAGGAGSTSATVTITDTTPGAVIYYTTDGSAPSTSSTTYTAPITVTQSTTVNAFATAADYINSPVAALTVAAGPAFVPSGASGSDAAITVSPGATTGNTSTISVVGTNGFSGTVKLSCSISPTAASDPATCSLSPASVTLSGNTAQTSTLTVTTTGAATSQSRIEKLFWPSTGGTTLALVLLIWVPRRWRGLLAMAGIVVLFASIGAIGCGGGGGGGGGGENAGTSAGSYTVTVTGTGTSMGSSNSVTATVGTVTLVVN
ncbi:MAG: FG-GAP-like repeat-containing protein [Acidobacteriaceae bacterium]